MSTDSPGPPVRLSAEQQAFLDEPHFAVVATIGSSGLPHQTVMWYLRQDQQLLLSCPQNSAKHRHLRRDNRLSVCVAAGFRYLTLSGTVTVHDTDHTAARALYSQIGQRYVNAMTGPRAAPAPGADVLELLRRERVTLTLSVEHMHGNGW